MHLVMKIFKSAYYFLAVALISSCSTTGTSHLETSIRNDFPEDATVTEHYQISDDGTLKILTLNIAHGRNQAANQLLLDKDEIEMNLR